MMSKKTQASCNRALRDALCELGGKPKSLFGGHFLDHSQRVLHINTIEDQPGNGTKLLPDSLAGHVQLHSVRYSCEELDALQSAVTDSLFSVRGLGVHMTDVDVVHNCVYIGVDADSIAIRTEIEHELAKHGFADRGMYRIAVRDRIGAGDEDAENPTIMRSVIQPISNTTPVTVMPGGFAGRLDSALESPFRSG